MLRHTVPIALILVAAPILADANVALECRRPARPVIPDGSVATEQELLNARTALEAYLAAANDFLECLRRFEEGLGEAIEETDTNSLVQRYNAMVDEMYLAGDEFNIALRRFKAR